jgi:hypothetical protein
MSKKTREFVPPGLSFIADNIISKQNILGVSKREKAKWAYGIDFSKKTETIFFAGCGYQYSSSLESLMSLIRRMDKSVIGSDVTMGMASFQKRLGINASEIYRKVLIREDATEAAPLKDAVKVLKNLGVEFGYLAEDEPCCGGLLYYAGLNSDFEKNACKVYQKFESFGVKRIISIVPSCTYTLKTLISNCVPEYDIEVKHFSQVVLDNIHSKTLCFPQEVKVVYHDPCQLGRYLNVIDEPREILKSIKGVEFVEPDWTKGEWATCCGGGGGFEVVFPELSEMLAVRRTEELVKTGAQIIITQCPGCIMQLKDGLRALKLDNVAVLDMAQVIAIALGV